MRVAKMYVSEVFQGLNTDNFPEIHLMEDTFYKKNAQMILLKDIRVVSFCEHHFVPMTGLAQIAYIPNGYIIGLSKINRIISYFARRPQIQERLTMQIADSLSNILKTQDIAVSITLKHSCVAIRGVQDDNNVTTTHYFNGSFQENNKEFFQSLN